LNSHHKVTQATNSQTITRTLNHIIVMFSKSVASMLINNSKTRY